MTEARKEHKELFWQTQTQVENQHFENFRQERHTKQHADMNRWRTSIARIALATRDKMEYLQRKEDATLETMRQADIKNMRQKMSNKLMLDAM